MSKGWADLAASVIDSAIKEREKALVDLERNPDCVKAKAQIEDTDEFFGSEWFGVLLEMSGIEVDAEEMRKRIYDIKGISISGVLSEQGDKGKGKKA